MANGVAGLVIASIVIVAGASMIVFPQVWAGILTVNAEGRLGRRGGRVFSRSFMIAMGSAFIAFGVVLLLIALGILLSA